MTEMGVLIGELARLIGRQPNTIIRWERANKIPHSYRDEKGWRRWSQDDVTKIIQQVSRSDVT
jgi:DNA-binding transcriptional MerR regulator